MTEYSSPKAWAIANGYDVKPGPGRMAGHITAAYRAAMAGTVKPLVSAASGTTAKPEKPKPRLTEAGIVEPAPKTWPDHTVAYAWINGKKVSCSLRQCCFNCRVSLQWCVCGAPRALVTNTSGYIPVSLEIPDA
jgi:hypothetical protein